MEQTNRTILFEEINPNKQNLLTLIGDVKGQESLTDEIVDKIHEQLEVKSFQQFIDKFQPGIYMYLNTSQCKVSFSYQCYQLEGYERSRIALANRNSLLSVILELMDSKKQKQYLLKNFNYILKCLIPKDNTKRFIYQRRQLLEFFCENNLEAAKDIYKNMIEEGMESLFLLTTFLQEAYEVMIRENEEDLKNRFITDNVTSNLVSPVAISKNLQKRKGHLSEEIQKSFFKFLENLMLDCPPKSDKELLFSCILLPTITTRNQLYELQPVYEKYLECYSNLIKMFWIQGKPLLEQLLGVKMYFEQYGDISDGMAPVLVISNFSPKDILNMDARRRLEIYLETVNRKNYTDNTLWYGIIPSIAFEDYEKEKKLRERFQGTKEKIQYPANNCQEVSVLLKILTEYKIQTFLSPQVTEKNTYQWVREHGIENWTEVLREYEGLEKLEYVIPCYPNFVVIPKEQAQLKIGYNINYDELHGKIHRKGEKKVWLDGLGVEAAYIVAGLFAACQCPKYLKEKFKKNIDDTLPGVAYRITENNHELITTTTMPREVLTFPEELAEEIQRKGIGVILVPYQGKIVVGTDRTLAFKKGIDDKVFHIQTLNYIRRVIRYVTQDYKENLIKQFFQNKIGNTKMQWMENQKSINSILKEGETMGYEIDEENHTCTFTVIFEKNRKGETVRIAK